MISSDMLRGGGGWPNSKIRMEEVDLEVTDDSLYFGLNSALFRYG